MPVELQINNADLAGLIRALDKIGDPKLLKASFDAMGQEVIDKAGKYPSKSIANDPSNPSGHWYERGFGTRYASGKGYQTSEDLGKRWYQTTFPSYLEVGNLASYAGYVHGTDEEQMPYHKARGWKQLLATAEDVLPSIVEKLSAQIGKIWEAT